MLACHRCSGYYTRHMSNLLQWKTTSVSAESTELLAEHMGRALKGGEVIELVSDLGGGKTTFVRGLMRGMGSEDKVASPTFTVSKLYRAGTLEIHHFDFYRLQEAGIIANEIEEVAGDPQAVVVVEWADVVQHVLPAERITITIVQSSTGDRELTISYPESLSYVVEAAQ
jgi:tRNA threonylcarbamoyladenosine biosynthesis protein TsaE